MKCFSKRINLAPKGGKKSLIHHSQQITTENIETAEDHQQLYFTAAGSSQLQRYDCVSFKPMTLKLSLCLRLRSCLCCVYTEGSQLLLTSISRRRLCLCAHTHTHSYRPDTDTHKLLFSPLVPSCSFLEVIIRRLIRTIPPLQIFLPLFHSHYDHHFEFSCSTAGRIVPLSRYSNFPNCFHGKLHFTFLLLLHCLNGKASV